MNGVKSHSTTALRKMMVRAIQEGAHGTAEMIQRELVGRAPRLASTEDQERVA